MQLPNRFQNISSERTKFYIVIGLVLLPIVASIIFLVYFRSSSSSNPDEYYDSGSGETVSNPKNKTPERFGVDSPMITYLGFSKLLDIGTTTDQLNTIKSAMERFATTEGRSITELSVTVDTIEQIIDDNGSISLTFDLTANRTTKYSCLVKYSGLSNATVIVSDSSDKQVFDSSTQ